MATDTSWTRRAARLVLGLGLVALGLWIASHADRGPGRVGEVFRRARERGHPSGALFYTELEDWRSIDRHATTAHGRRDTVTGAAGSAPTPP